MVCDTCNTPLLEGEPDIVNSSSPVGVRIGGKHLGGLACFICPQCGKVTFQLNKKAKEALAKILNK